MFFPNLNIPIAGLDKYHHNLSTPHVTSCNFGEPAPVYYRFLDIGDTIKVQPSFTIRTQPLVLPTYGKVYSKLHSFFVPFRLVYSNFVKWREGQRTIGANMDLPKINTLQIYELFTSLLCARSQSAAGSSPFDFLAYDVGVDFRSYTDEISCPDYSELGTIQIPYDFCVYDIHQGFWKCIQLTSLGRYWLRIFNSLGYSWNWLAWPNAHKSVEIVSLGCFFKAYLDFFVPSQYQNAHPISAFLNSLDSSQGNIQQLLMDVIKKFPCAYDSDYFTSAWSTFDSQIPQDGNYAPNPFSPLFTDNLGRPNNDDVYNEEKVFDTASTGPVLEQYLGETTLTSFGLRVLRAVDNYLTRNNWAGSRAVERILARFGVKVPEFRYNYTEYCGSDASEFNISDVTNLTESHDFDLGSYAGKMWNQNLSKQFVYDAKEPGLFIIIHAIMPAIDYYQGTDRLHLCLNRFDWYTQEFDSIGNDAIPVAEIYDDFGIGVDNAQIASEVEIDTLTTGDNPNLPKKIFGFLPRYTHFKVPRGWLTGAYRVPSLRMEIDGFNLYRKISATDAIRAQGNFLYMDSKEYDRIFSVDENLSDKFFPSFYFNVDLESKMKSISDSIPLDGKGDMSVTSNGNILN